MRASRTASVLGLLLAACTFDGSGLAALDDGGPPSADGSPLADGAPRPDGASPSDANADAALPGTSSHLLLTEIKAHSQGDEFIEIFNPTKASIDLTDYYLADHADYAKVPVLFGGSGQAPNLDARFDFIVRFPPGASIKPNEVIVVALDGAVFEETYGFEADFAIANDDDDAPMLLVAGSATPTISDAGEGIVLFYWDGISDLVADVDMVTAGNNPSGGNRLPNKTNLSVDGPDPGNTPTQYAPDAFTIGDLDADTGAGLSYKRIALEDPHELRPAIANGLTGHDETSEDIRKTWDGAATFTAPTPGTIPDSLRP